MVNILKHTHLVLVLIAVLMFIVCFYWQRTGHNNAQKSVFKKALLHTHLTIFVIGGLLIWLQQIDLFATEKLFLIEKVGAFIAYSVMVFASLNKEQRKGIQLFAFIGAFGWLAYIGMLVGSKQAILLLG